MHKKCVSHGFIWLFVGRGFLFLISMVDLSTYLHSRRPSRFSYSTSTIKHPSQNYLSCIFPSLLPVTLAAVLSGLIAHRFDLHIEVSWKGLTVATYTNPNSSLSLNISTISLIHSFHKATQIHISRFDCSSLPNALPQAPPNLLCSSFTSAHRQRPHLGLNFPELRSGHAVSYPLPLTTDKRQTVSSSTYLPSD